MMWDLAYLLVPSLVCLLICALLWLLFGRDPWFVESIFPHYEPPKDLSVVEAGVLMDDILQTKDFSYELYDLYFKGIIAFKDNNIILLKELQSPEVTNLLVIQQAILNKLFTDSIKTIGLNADLTHLKTKKIKSIIYKDLTQRKFYKHSPEMARGGYYLLGYFLIIGSIGFNVVSFFSQFEQDDYSKHKIDPFYLPLSLVIGLVLAGLVVGIFGTLMAKKTITGMKKKNELLGFKEFVITAEKDRIEYFLKEEPEVYKEILPFAFLFGVKENWLAPAKDLSQKLLDDDLQKITLQMDLDAFEQLFEEKRNIVIGLINIICFAIISAVKMSLENMFRSKYDKWR